MAPFNQRESRASAVSPFIMLYLGSIAMDYVISELCYIGIILQRNYRKTAMVIFLFLCKIPW